MPFGAREAPLGIYPISIAVTSDLEGRALFDMATSVVAFDKDQARGEEIRAPNVFRDSRCFAKLRCESRYSRAASKPATMLFLLRLHDPISRACFNLTDPVENSDLSTPLLEWPVWSRHTHEDGILAQP